MLYLSAPLFFAHRIVCEISHCLLAPHANMLSSVTFLTQIGHYNTDFPISSWQPVPRLLAAACRHLARRFFLTQPAAPAKKQQPTCLGNRLQSVRALMTDLGLTNPNQSLGHELIAADHLPRGIKAQAARQTRRIYPAITPCLVTNYGVFGLQLRRIWLPFCC